MLQEAKIGEKKTKWKKDCGKKVDPNIRKKRKIENNMAKKKSKLSEKLEDHNEKIFKKLPDWDRIPSDSEEDQSGDLEGDSNRKKVDDKTAARKLYTDFTENTIFVGNLPLSYNKKKVIKVFSTFGKVICARIRCVPVANINMRKKVAAIKKEFNPHRNSCIAYVKFKSEESVSDAIKANGMLLDGHHLRIDSAKNTGEKDSNKAVFVGGLPFDIEDEELWSFFESCGKINSVRVVRDSHTSMGKGIGFVNFDSTAAVELALQMDGQELKKRTINVKRCLSTLKKNKMRSFDRKKTKEVVGQLLSKKNQAMLKKKNKKLDSLNICGEGDFSGTKATIKKKRKKKLSKDVLRKRKILKVLKVPSNKL